MYAEIHIIWQRFSTITSERNHIFLAARQPYNMVTHTLCIAFQRQKYSKPYFIDILHLYRKHISVVVYLQ